MASKAASVRPYVNTKISRHPWALQGQLRHACDQRNENTDHHAGRPELLSTGQAD